MLAPATVQLPAAVRRSAQVIAVSAVVSALSATAALVALRHLDSASVTYLKLVAEEGLGPGTAPVDDLRSDLLLHAVVSGFGVVVLAPLAFAIRRPSRIARIVAWVCALLLSSALGLVVAISPEVMVAPDELASPAFNRALANLLASWYPGLTSVLVLVQIAGALVFSLLLLREGAADYYAAPHQDGPAGLWTAVRPPDPQ